MVVLEAFTLFFKECHHIFAAEALLDYCRVEQHLAGFPDFVQLRLLQLLRCEAAQCSSAGGQISLANSTVHGTVGRHSPKPDEIYATHMYYI
jgi:hypothetical protein